jgi:hypothetical protein
MTKLYIDIDGVILTAKQDAQADHLTRFINFIVDNFDCYWLTNHCKGNALHTLSYLSIYVYKDIIDKLHKVKPTNWNTLKTEAIDFTNDFFWLDDAPFPAEIEVLKSHDQLNRLIKVNLDNANELLRIINLLQSAK